LDFHFIILVDKKDCKYCKTCRDERNAKKVTSTPRRKVKAVRKKINSPFPLEGLTSEGEDDSEEEEGAEDGEDYGEDNSEEEEEEEEGAESEEEESDLEGKEGDDYLPGVEKKKEKLKRILASLGNPKASKLKDPTVKRQRPEIAKKERPRRTGIKYDLPAKRLQEEKEEEGEAMSEENDDSDYEDEEQDKTKGKGKGKGKKTPPKDKVKEKENGGLNLHNRRVTFDGPALENEARKATKKKGKQPAKSPKLKQPRPWGKRKTMSPPSSEDEGLSLPKEKLCPKGSDHYGCDKIQALKYFLSKAGNVVCKHCITCREKRYANKGKRGVAKKVIHTGKKEAAKKVIHTTPGKRAGAMAKKTKTLKSELAKNAKDKKLAEEERKVDKAKNEKNETGAAEGEPREKEAAKRETETEKEKKKKKVKGRSKSKRRRRRRERKKKRRERKKKRKMQRRAAPRRKRRGPRR